MHLSKLVPILFVALPAFAQLKGAEWQAYTSMRDIDRLLVYDDAVWAITAGGVLRYDPLLKRAERRQLVRRMRREFEEPGGDLSATMLPEQYYPAQRLEEWNHIDGSFNREIIELGRPGALKGARILHYSCQSGFTEPAPWLDADPSDFKTAVKEWYEEHRDLLPIWGPSGDVVARAFAVWRGVFEELRADAWAWPPCARDALEEARLAVAQWAPTERDLARQRLEYRRVPFHRRPESE